MSGQDMLDQACTGYVRLNNFKTQTLFPIFLQARSGPYGSIPDL